MGCDEMDVTDVGGCPDVAWQWAGHTAEGRFSSCRTTLCGPLTHHPTTIRCYVGDVSLILDSTRLGNTLLYRMLFLQVARAVEGEARTKGGELLTPQHGGG